MGVPEHHIILIKGLYLKKEVAVRKEYGNTEWFEVRTSVRQGCILPLTYSTCIVNISRQRSDLKIR